MTYLHYRFAIQNGESTDMDVVDSLVSSFNNSFHIAPMPPDHPFNATPMPPVNTINNFSNIYPTNLASSFNSNITPTPSFNAQAYTIEDIYADDEDDDVPEPRKRKVSKQRGPKKGQSQYGYIYKLMSELKDVNYTYDMVHEWLSISAQDFIALNWVLNSKDFREEYFKSNRPAPTYDKCGDIIEQYIKFTDSLDKEPLLQEIKNQKHTGDQLRKDIHELTTKLTELKYLCAQSFLKLEICNNHFNAKTDTKKKKYESLKNIFAGYEHVLKMQNQV